RSVFDPTIYAKTLDWIAGDIPWRLRCGDFYDYYECNPALINPPGDCSVVFGADTRARLAQWLEDVFATRLSERSKMTLHKMVPPQRIGIHNDSPSEESEPHRLVVTLTSHWNESHSGYLALLSGPDPDAIVDVIPPLGNSGFAFEMSDHSYHAVSSV